MDSSEKHWTGQGNWCEKDVVVNCIQTSDGKKWIQDSEGLRLDPDYSDWSVRIFDPSHRSLSWVLCTVAILPKSLLQRIYDLIGEYLGVHEERQSCCMVDGGGCPICLGSCDGDLPETAKEDDASCGTCRNWGRSPGRYNGRCRNWIMLTTDSGGWCNEWEAEI